MQNFHFVESFKLPKLAPVSPLGRTFARDYANLLRKIHRQLAKFDKNAYRTAHSLIKPPENYTDGDPAKLKDALQQLDIRLQSIEPHYAKLSCLGELLQTKSFPLSGLEQVPQMELRDLIVQGEVTRPLLVVFEGIGKLHKDSDY